MAFRNDLYAFFNNLCAFFASTVVLMFLAAIIFVAVKFHHHEQPPVQQLQQNRVTLIHRDVFLNTSSPKLNYTAWINARLQRDTERVAALTQLLNFPSATPGPVVFFGSSGEFLVPLKIGYPPVTQHLIIDTGSDLTWVQCQPCEHCNTQWDPLYTLFEADSHSIITNCSSEECSLLGKHTSGCRQYPNESCTYEYVYGDGSFSKGKLINESVKVGGVRYDNLSIGCGTNNVGSTLDMIPGIMGLGDGPLAFVNQLGDMHRKGFSYCLSTNSLTPTGWLEFGLGSDPQDTLWVPLQQKQINGFPFYYISIYGVWVNNERLPIPEDVFQGEVFLDSGTVITRFPKEVYEVLRDAYVAKTANIPRTPPYALFDTCYDLTNADLALLPFVTFFFPTDSIPFGTLSTPLGWVKRRGTV